MSVVNGSGSWGSARLQRGPTERKSPWTMPTHREKGLRSLHGPKTHPTSPHAVPPSPVIVVLVPEPQTDSIRHFPEPQTGPNPALPQTAAAVVHAAAPAPSLVVSTRPSFVVDLAHILSTAIQGMRIAPPLSNSPHLQPRLAKQGSLPSSTLPPLRQALLDRLVSQPWSPVTNRRLVAIPCSLARLSIWHSGTCLRHRGSRMLGHT